MFAGIDIGGTNIKLIVLNATGRVIARRSIPSMARRGPRHAFSRVSSVLLPLAEKKGSLVRAGVACAGLVEHPSGRLHSSPNLHEWEDTPLARIAREHLGVYSVVDNDANAAAYGEYFRGCGRGRGTFICLTLGTGVGGAVVVDGRLLRGSRNYAGEIGHMTICETGPRCHCGNRGCLEAYVGAYALVREARAKSRGRSRYLRRWIDEGRPLTPKLIADAAARGDRAARSVYEEAGARLGTALANLINIFNPDVIALAGGVAGGLDLMRPRMDAEIRKRAFAESRRVARIVPAKLGVDAAGIGAALMARDSASGAARHSRRRS
jgi:glucokinase